MIFGRKPTSYDCEHGISQVSTVRRTNSFMHYYTKNPRYSNGEDAEYIFVLIGSINQWDV